MYGTNLNAIYVTKPRDYNPLKSYPVVFFAHGYMGSWELYNGLLNRMDDCIVVSIATRDISGKFEYKDVEKCFSQYIPYLEREGYKVDKTSLHLMGLSNGGSAANVALESFSDRLASVTYISTGCGFSKPTQTKVLLIGGGQDTSSVGLSKAYERLKSVGAPVELYWNERANHFMFVHEFNEVMGRWRKVAF